MLLQVGAHRLHQRVTGYERESGPLPDPEVFTREILPGLEAVSVGEMVRATGLTSGFCSMIKRGLRMPHPRHWQALRALT